MVCSQCHCQCIILLLCAVSGCALFLGVCRESPAAPPCSSWQMPCGPPLCPQGAVEAWGEARGAVEAEAGAAGAGEGGAGAGAVAGAGVAGGAHLHLMQMIARMVGVRVWMLMRAMRQQQGMGQQQQQEDTGQQQQGLGAWGMGSTLLEVCLGIWQGSSGSSERHGVLCVRQPVNITFAGIPDATA